MNGINILNSLVGMIYPLKRFFIALNVLIPEDEEVGETAYKKQQ